MADFLRELAATHCVGSAAKAVGMSRQSAYKLRSRLKGQPFDIAWEAAFLHGYDELAQVALERALFGIEVPVYHKGEQIGVRRHYDERLTCFLLARRGRTGTQRLGRYTAASEFWSERWDKMLERVESGAVDWEKEGDETPEDFEQREAVAAAELGRRHAPDPLPKGRVE